jgi:Spy/CpxP family protein refolding chaperone
MVKSAKLKGGLILVGVFVLGGLAGGAGMRAYMQRDYAEELTAGPAERLGRRHFMALSRELDLSDEQREKVREIMRKHRPEREQLMQQLAEDCGAPLGEHKAKLDAEIRSVLDPEQQKRFDALLEKQDQRFSLGGRHRGGKGKGGMRRRMKRGGPGGPAPGTSGDRPGPERPGRGGPIQRFDEDGDGMLSEQEVPPRLWERISEADVDGDGLVTREELREHRGRSRDE